MGPQVITDSGQWAGNGLRFATQEEAATYVAEFSLVRSTRVFESSDPVNYRWNSGRLEGHCEQGRGSGEHGQILVEKLCRAQRAIVGELRWLGACTH